MSYRFFRLTLSSLIVTGLSTFGFSQAIDPVLNEDFESTPEFSLPAGWTAENFTDPDEGSFVNGETANLANSQELEGWTVLTTAQLQSISANRLSVPAAVSGKSVYAESDQRSGLQFQFLYTPMIDLTGMENILLRFDSNYTQNQDNICYAEYTLDGNLPLDDPGKTWYPIFYWVDSPEVEAANGDVEAVFFNGIDDGANLYIDWIGADLSEIDFDTHIEGLINDDQNSSKGRKVYALPNAANQPRVQIRFFQGGGASWYWGIDNVVVGPESQVSGGAPEKPVLTVSATQVGITDNVVLTGSAYNSPGSVAHGRTTWEVATDSGFTSLVYELAGGPETLLEIQNSRLPLNTDLYARVKYADDNLLESAFSDTVSFQISPPPGAVQIFSEDFESASVGGLPSGWTEKNFSAPAGNPDVDIFGRWSVVTPDILSSIGSDRVNVQVFDNQSVYTDSDATDVYHEAHLLTPVIDLSGTTGVYLSFSSNYVQNQDNIGVLEYTVDGGDVEDNGLPSGTWLPIAYLLDQADITFTADGSVDAEATFTLENTADGTDFAYADYIFAAITGTSVADLAPYVSPRVNDDKVESKRFEKYRLPAADNQSSVRIRWMNMGTDSWFWGVDNVVVWGDNGTSVDQWSLY